MPSISVLGILSPVYLEAIERSAEDLQNKQLKLVRGDLSGIQAGQEAVAEKVQESLTAVHSIFQQAVGLQAQMQTSINLEVCSSCRRKQNPFQNACLAGTYKLDKAMEGSVITAFHLGANVQFALQKRANILLCVGTCVLQVPAQPMRQI